jgi:hypothetical protein
MVVSDFVILFVSPLCHCPRYYIYLSIVGVVPLLCGPRLYRWFGAAYIFTALFFAISEHRAALNQAEQIAHIRAQAQPQHP